MASINDIIPALGDPTYGSSIQGSCFHHTSCINGKTTFTNISNDANGNAVAGGGFILSTLNSTLESPTQLMEVRANGDVVLNNHTTNTTCGINSTTVNLSNDQNSSTLTASQLALSSGNPSLPGSIVMTDTTTTYTNNLQFNQILMVGNNANATVQPEAVFLQNGDNTRQIVLDLNQNQIYCADENGYGSKISTQQNVMYDRNNNNITITPTVIAMTDVNASVLSEWNTNYFIIGNVILKAQTQPSGADGMLNWDGKVLSIFNGNESVWKEIAFV
jgi:hypothetical protein